MDGALALLGQVDEVWVAKGKRVDHFNLKQDQPASVAPFLLGPTGNLRAPILRIGRKLLVGFDEDTYRTVFG